jgi:Domain of unknown function (DUF929)
MSKATRNRQQSARERIAAQQAAAQPEMLYIGAEFCPFCAAMRWSMAVALSRFGTLSPLRGIHSSSTDTFPDTATLTFYQSGYSSKYLTFTAVENEKIDHSPLQDTTPRQQAVWDNYQPDAVKRGYPFIDIGNKYMLTYIYNPQVLAGTTRRCWRARPGARSPPRCATRPAPSPRAPTARPTT